MAICCVVFSCKQHTGSENTDKEKPVAALKAAADTDKVIPADKLIVPGKSAGYITINGSADSVVNLLGKPDFNDAAMGSVLITWYNKHDTAADKISIFARHNYGSPDEAVAHIRKIMITSPEFKTADGLGTGQTLSDYQKSYTLSPMSSYVEKGKKIKVYEAKGKGIAFGIDSLSDNGVSIFIHRPQDTLATYINMN